jgi:putative transposase
VIQHHDHGSQYTSLAYSERRAADGIRPSMGVVGSSYDNALAETINGLYKTELIKARGPWRTIDQVEVATAESGSTEPGPDRPRHRRGTPGDTASA